MVLGINSFNVRGRALSSSLNAVYGQQSQFTQGSDYNAIAFMVAQMLSKRHYMALVRVVNVTDPGGVALTGSVDVQPLVTQVDGAGNPVPHGVLYSLPYFRLQGGSNAVIITPAVNDIGMAVFADRDISGVKGSRDQAAPASRRQNDMADGLYLGGFLNGVPTQYIQFADGGIKVLSPSGVQIQSPVISTGNGGDLRKLVTEIALEIFNTHTHPLDIPHGVTLPTTTPMTNECLTQVLEAE